MKAFSALLDALSFTPGRNGKLRLMIDYFHHAPDPDRGHALAALTDCLDFPHAKPALVRDLALSRVDPVLFGYSHDFVGDLAETVALVWPAHTDGTHVPALGEVVEILRLVAKESLPALLEGWLDALDATGRWALLKLMTGELRVGVSARLAKTALAEWGGLELAEVEEVWHGLRPPYAALFAWVEGRGPRPGVEEEATFRPFMLSTPLDEAELARMTPADYAAEWKWDGIRVQFTCRGGSRRLFARSGDEISAAFPDLIEAANFDAVLDGELLVVVTADGAPASFNALQQRLNRKTVTPKLLKDYPAHIRVYDMLFCHGTDLRPLPWQERRARLEAWFAKPRAKLSLSPLIPFQSWPELAELRLNARDAGIEGLMLKRRDSLYLPGRPKGPWFKWKRDALTFDAVLMYAQRGHGKRSSYYSDYTFGAWAGDRLVPVGKAYFGFTDEELLELDRWIRTNTVNRFGPVLEVRPGLVLEVAFDSVHRSSRHRSGVAMRFPRVHRIRWDKPAAEAVRLEELERLVT